MQLLQYMGRGIGLADPAAARQIIHGKIDHRNKDLHESQEYLILCL